MIQATETHLALTPAVCKALLAFASYDETRGALCGIGIDKGAVCATDGYTAVRFNTSVGNTYNGRIFPREYCETQVKLAAAIKSPAVHLDWSKAVTSGYQFPPLDSVIPKTPKIQIKPADMPAFNTSYLSRLEVVSKACAQAKDPDPKKSDRKPRVPPAQFKITNLAGPFDPIVFTVGDNSGAYSHYATVVIMPERL